MYPSLFTNPVLIYSDWRPTPRDITLYIRDELMPHVTPWKGSHVMPTSQPHPNTCTIRYHSIQCDVTSFDAISQNTQGCVTSFNEIPQNIQGVIKMYVILFHEKYHLNFDLTSHSNVRVQFFQSWSTNLTPWCTDFKALFYHITFIHHSNRSRVL